VAGDEKFVSSENYKTKSTGKIRDRKTGGQGERGRKGEGSPNAGDQNVFKWTRVAQKDWGGNRSPSEAKTKAGRGERERRKERKKKNGLGGFFPKKKVRKGTLKKGRTTIRMKIKGTKRRKNERQETASRRVYKKPIVGREKPGKGKKPWQQ